MCSSNGVNVRPDCVLPTYMILTVTLRDKYVYGSHHSGKETGMKRPRKCRGKVFIWKPQVCFPANEALWHFTGCRRCCGHLPLLSSSQRLALQLSDRILMA